ncbi:hypothetical protein GCM10023116_36480 [Kistimonas scapharcae]|uniref:Uncharacterized protein n=1 Tax=Kistimonas scapharcae TaxID=1036133 RepID=A0ABP8V735_9GAMM
MADLTAADAIRHGHGDAFHGQKAILWNPDPVAILVFGFRPLVGVLADGDL